MRLTQLNIINFRNIEAADIRLDRKITCFVGNNGMGKTNLLDAIYHLSFCKSAFNNIDSQNIRHNADFALIQGCYMSDKPSSEPTEENIICNIRRGKKKQFRRGKKDYQRLLDHIGLIPLVMLSPQDGELITEGSDGRRRFMDGVISQLNNQYLQSLTDYNALLKQRNALLKQAEETATMPDLSLFEIIEEQMADRAQYIYTLRKEFAEQFVPIFSTMYAQIAADGEQPNLQYKSQLDDRQLREAYAQTRQRDLILGWTSQGIHKDDLIMTLNGYPIQQIGSQGQQKTYIAALKLAQAIYMSQIGDKPILLLDDIFDKLDAKRVERIIQIVTDDRFGQIFITDTDRQHLTSLLTPQTGTFVVSNGELRQA